MCYLCKANVASPNLEQRTLTKAYAIFFGSTTATAFRIPIQSIHRIVIGLKFGKPVCLHEFIVMMNMPLHSWVCKVLCCYTQLQGNQPQTYNLQEILSSTAGMNLGPD